MKNVRRGLVLLLLAPSTALAHGEQIAGLPLGQLAAVIIVLLAAFVVRMPGKHRALVVALSIVSLPIPWVLPGFFFFVGDHFGYGIAPWLVIGILNPLLAASLTFACIRPRTKSPTTR